jgi:hypothetical protein
MTLYYGITESNDIGACIKYQFKNNNMKSDMWRYYGMYGMVAYILCEMFPFRSDSTNSVQGFSRGNMSGTQLCDG